MNEPELIRKLNSVGKTIFIEYFSTFKAYADGQLSKAQCIELLVSNGVSNESGSSIRLGNSKLLFEYNKVCGALNIVSKSKRLPPGVVRMAVQLINEHCNKVARVNDQSLAQLK